MRSEGLTRRCRRRRRSRCPRSKHRLRCQNVAPITSGLFLAVAAQASGLRIRVCSGRDRQPVRAPLAVPFYRRPRLYPHRPPLSPSSNAPPPPPPAPMPTTPRNSPRPRAPRALPLARRYSWFRNKYVRVRLHRTVPPPLPRSAAVRGQPLPSLQSASCAAAATPAAPRPPFHGVFRCGSLD